MKRFNLSDVGRDGFVVRSDEYAVAPAIGDVGSDLGRHVTNELGLLFVESCHDVFEQSRGSAREVPIPFNGLLRVEAQDASNLADS